MLHEPPRPRDRRQRGHPPGFPQGSGRARAPRAGTRWTLLECRAAAGPAALTACRASNWIRRYQGEEGVQMAAAALRDERPYALAFVDMRMPPGWDGLKTIEHLWEADPDIQVVICSAHSDYEWSEVMARLKHSDKLLVLRKPFEPIEVQQCASALCQKWHNERTDPQPGGTRSRKSWPRAPGAWRPPTGSCATWPRMMRSPGCPTARCSTTGCARPWRRPCATSSALRCWCATWTASSWSTIRWAITPATCSCRKSRAGLPASCAKATRWHARVAMNSCSC